MDPAVNCQRVEKVTGNEPAEDRRTDVDRLDMVRFLVLAAEREGKRMMTASLRHVGLTPAQSEVLEVVRQRGPLTLAELGRLVVCETGSPSRLVDTLVRRGFLDREPTPGDKRAVTLSLTPAGQATVEKAVKVGGVRDHITHRLTSDEVNELARLLSRLVADTPGGNAVANRFPAVRAAHAATT
jgi:MarR family transcriptional regulator, organic hydroperoxide resistance regulator